MDRGRPCYVRLLSGSRVSRLHVKPKLFRGPSNPVIKTQKLDSGDS